MTGARLAPLFAPRGIAVVGASADATKMGSVMLRSLAASTTPVVAVNERLDGPADGLYPSVRAGGEAAGATIDLAVLCVPAAVCPGALRRAAGAGVRAALVCAGGFGETGPAGAATQQELVDVARDHGIRLLGPNTSGFLAPAHHLYATFVPGARAVPAGRIGVVAASGGVNHALAFLLAEAGHGLSLGVGLGNAADVTTADVVDHLAADPGTAAIALHIESVADGPALLDAVRRAAAAKPVVALVVGRADVGDFAKSHTGALATAWRTTRALLAQAGAVVVDDERELVDAVGQLSLVRLQPAADPGVALVTAQAGPGLLVLDSLRDHGVRIPPLAPATQAAVGDLLPPMTFQQNPVDTGRPGDSFAGVLTAVAEDPEVDLVAVYALSEPDAVDLADAVSIPMRAGHAVTASVGGPTGETTPIREKLLGDGVPVHAGPRGLSTAVRAAVTDARQRFRAQGAADPATEAKLPRGVRALVESTPEWDEAAAKDLLDLLGIGTPHRRVCPSPGAALAALGKLRPPLAVKLLDARVLHKTEIGGVRLGVRTPDQLMTAVEALRRAGARSVLVEEMAPEGVDLIVGARRDPVFGPVVLVGLGGTAAEAIADVAIRSAPVSPAEAGAMPGELQGRALLDGWRGGPALVPEDLATVVSRLGRLLVEHPHLDEVEINPLRLTRHGLIALDAVITTRSIDAQPDQ